MVLTHYCNGVLEGEDSGFTVNQGDMFLSAMGISEKLQQPFFGKEIVAEYKSEVMEYLSVLLEANGELTSTTAYKWNLKMVNQHYVKIP